MTTLGILEKSMNKTDKNKQNKLKNETELLQWKELTVQWRKKGL